MNRSKSADPCHFFSKSVDFKSGTALFENFPWCIFTPTACKMFFFSLPSFPGLVGCTKQHGF